MAEGLLMEWPLNLNRSPEEGHTHGRRDSTACPAGPRHQGSEKKFKVITHIS